MLRKLTLLLNKIGVVLRFKTFNIQSPGNIQWGKHIRISFPNQNAKLKIGSLSRIGHGVIFKLDGSHISMGTNCFIDDYAVFKLWGGNIELGDNVYINSFTVLNGHGGLKIGNNVLIAMHVSIVPSNHNFDNKDIPINQQGNTNKGIVIEDNVWIGAGARILDGLTIGRGAVIAAGAVVTKNIAAGAIVKGIPAK